METRSFPDVSVIIATFNRSAVIRHVLAVLRRQTCESWEAIVVDDGCTDDTESVVRSFGDPRLRFVNLADNHGEQSAPNNAGVRLARGRFLAFLNHGVAAALLTLVAAALVASVIPARRAASVGPVFALRTD